MSDITHIVEQTQFASNTAMEFLAYRLGGEEYGIPIHQVQELRRYEKTTKIANMPEHIKGVINLRGTIVPIIDLRLIFKHATVTYDELTVVIILNLVGRLTGIVVESVSDVVTLASTQIKPPPAVDTMSHQDYLRGIGEHDERLLILVDIEKMIACADHNESELLAA